MSSEETNYTLVQRAKYSLHALWNSRLVQEKELSEESLDEFVNLVNYALPDSEVEVAQMNIFKQLFHADKNKMRSLYHTKSETTGKPFLTYYVLWTDCFTIALHFHVADEVRLTWDGDHKCYNIALLSTEEKEQKKKRREQARAATEPTASDSAVGEQRARNNAETNTNDEKKGFVQQRQAHLQGRTDRNKGNRSGSRPRNDFAKHASPSVPTTKQPAKVLQKPSQPEPTSKAPEPSPLPSVLTVPAAPAVAADASEKKESWADA